MPTTITHDQLVKVGACLYARKKFQDFFGTEVTLTEELVFKHRADFDFDWAATHLLSIEVYQVYRKAEWPAFIKWRDSELPDTLATREYRTTIAQLFYKVYTSY